MGNNFPRRFGVSAVKKEATHYSPVRKPATKGINGRTDTLTAGSPMCLRDPRKMEVEGCSQCTWGGETGGPITFQHVGRNAVVASSSMGSRATSGTCHQNRPRSGETTGGLWPLEEALAQRLCHAAPAVRQRELFHRKNRSNIFEVAVQDICRHSK